MANSSAGTGSTCGLTTAGAAYCWGLNSLASLVMERRRTGLVQCPWQGAELHGGKRRRSAHVRDYDCRRGLLLG